MSTGQEARGGVAYRRPGVNDALDPFAITTLVALSAIWGLGQVAVKVVNSGMQPVFQAGLRSLLGCLLAMLWCRYRGVKLFEKDGTLVAGIVVGLLFGGEFILIYLGFDYTTVSRGIIFIFFAPLVVALGAHFLIPSERLTAVRTVGLVAAFLGVVVAFSDQLSLPSPDAIIGDIFCFIAAVLWGATTLVIKTTRLNLIAPEKVLIYQLAFSAPLMLAAAPFFGPFIRDIDAIVILAFAYQVVIIVSASYLVWFWLIAYYPAGQLHAFAFLSPLFTVMFGALLLGEPISPRLLIALALVAAGIYLVESATEAMTDTPKPFAASPGKPVRTPLPRRFYKEAGVGERDGAHALLLDGRGARTPARKPLAVASKPVAKALAAEWGAQGEHIDPATMPLTRIINSALDGVADQMDAVREEVVRYAGSDLICYRAGEPASLVERQEAAWAPLVAFARAELGARLMLAEGVVHVEQDQAALDAIGRAIADFDAVRLAALHTVMTLTGSTVLALAVARGRLSAEEAWAAAHVDEDWQMEQWGSDESALLRRAYRWREMQAAALILEATRT